MLKIGSHCDFCRQNDFLPFVCKKCNKLCCLDHREAHPCVDIPNEPIPDKPEAKQPSTRIPFKRPPQPAKQPARAQPALVQPEKKNALDKLRAYMATKPKRSNPAPKSSTKPSISSLDPLGSSGDGDKSIPEQNRNYMHIRRPQQSVIDAITGSSMTRPEKKLLVFYDKTKPIGFALDKARKSLGASSTSQFKLNGSVLPLSSPIAGIPPNSVIDLE